MAAIFDFRSNICRFPAFEKSQISDHLMEGFSLPGHAYAHDPS